MGKKNKLFLYGQNANQPETPLGSWKSGWFYLIFVPLRTCSEQQPSLKSGENTI
jgi:hypothetical protein